ncbi:MAG: hypothetical protein ACTXOO_03300 [Sodalis sp. (in: enterobacteria)]
MKHTLLYRCGHVVDRWSEPDLDEERVYYKGSNMTTTISLLIQDKKSVAFRKERMLVF